MAYYLTLSDGVSRIRLAGTSGFIILAQPTLASRGDYILLADGRSKINLAGTTGFLTLGAPVDRRDHGWFLKGSRRE